MVLDAAEAELALHLQGQEQQSPVAVPVWLQLMSLFSTDAPLLVGLTVCQAAAELSLIFYSCPTCSKLLY